MKQCSLLSRVPLQLIQIEFARFTGSAHGFLGFALAAAFGFVTLFLLTRMFFLAFGKT